MLLQPSGSHVDQLPLQVFDDPRHGQRRGMPREADLQTDRHESEKPARVELVAGKALQTPSATPTTGVEKVIGSLAAKSWNFERV